MDPQLQELLDRHGPAAATVCAWARDSGATRVVLLLDAGEEDAVLLDTSPGEPLEVARGEDTWFVDLADVPASVPAAEAPPAAPASSIHVSLESGEISAPIGAMDALATGVLALARAFGGRSVATVEYPTHDPNRPLTFAARDGDPVVVGIGDQHFELPTR